LKGDWVLNPKYRHFNFLNNEDLRASPAGFEGLRIHKVDVIKPV
jgi:hypothetical protein